MAEMTREQLKSIVREVLEQFMEPTIPIGISNRHVHLSEADYRVLFGDEPFEAVRPLQPGQYASNQTLTLEGPKGQLFKVRVLGPFRSQSQVELSNTDARTVGLDLPIRLSGDIDGTPGITLIGPKGRLELNKGVIVALRHIHMTPEDAKRFGVKNGQRVCVQVDGPRPLIFCDTDVRVGDDFRLEMHIDTDEANAAGAGTDLSGRIISK